MKRILFVTILLACAFVATDATAGKRENARAEVLSRSHGFYKEVFMEFDKEVLNELNKIMGTKQGKELQEKLKNTDKEKIKKMLSGLDLSAVDLNEVKKVLKNNSSETINENLKNAANKFFGGNNG